MYRLKIFILFILFSISTNGNPMPGQTKTTEKEATAIATKQAKTKHISYLVNEKMPNKKVVSISVILVILLFVLFYFFYQNNKLKQRLKVKIIRKKILLNIINAGIDSQEIERKKIASFLHDNVNALLSSAGLHLNTFTHQNNVQSEEIQKTKAILQDVHDLLRDMSHDLIPSLLIRFGLIYALEDLCEKNSNSSIHFDFLNSISTERRYVEKFEMKIYFIVSELFNNIIKHSGATKAQIQLKENGKIFKITIHDNGIGFKTKNINDAEGFGINRIRARVKKFKGSFSIISKANEGTTIKIKIPFPH